MTRPSVVRRRRRISGRDILHFAEAVLALTAASAAIKFLPFRTVVRMMGLPPPRQARRRDGDGELAIEVRRSVKRASRRLPWTVVCFPEGLAAHWMLRRRGAPSRVHYGLHQSETGLSAHVWTSLAGEVVVGEEMSDLHTCVAVFPSPHS